MKNETNHLPIVLARKPLSEKSIAENVLRWGTGGINIDGCRITFVDEVSIKISGDKKHLQKWKEIDGRTPRNIDEIENTPYENTKGRFPANIIFDEEAGKILDEQSGDSKSVKRKKVSNTITKQANIDFGGGIKNIDNTYGDTGGASRFFYEIKNEDKINKQINEKGKRMKNENVKLMLGDNIEKLRELPDNFVDSIITDPPYGLSFMNKKWDYDVPSVNFWKEVLRVLKPGGHVLSFGGTRTYHRMVVNMEDAGFEIRDQIMWVYGSGFPKSHNIGKAVDKIEGNDREYLGEDEIKTKKRPKKNEKEWNCYSKTKYDNSITKGNSDYEGWGTALKPANEPICMARKPLSEKTIAENVLEHGTGGINIDGCRIGSETISVHNAPKGTFAGGEEDRGSDTNSYREHEGRFPSNFIIDEEASKILDEQSGDSKSQGGKGKSTQKSLDRTDIGYGFKEIDNAAGLGGYGDTGGASRFFYVPKVSKKERNMGLDDFDDKTKNQVNNSNYKLQPNGEMVLNTKDTTSKNTHPTIKPINLLTYLVRLITPPNGVVMDCYMGSGSTGIAALLEGFQFIGMEMDEEYFNIAEARIDSWEQYKDLIKTK